MNREDYKEEKKVNPVRNLFGNWFGLFLIVVCGIALYTLIKNVDMLYDGMNSFFGFIKPVIYGAVIAYLLNPFVIFFQRTLLKVMVKKGKQPSKRVKKIARGLAIFFSILSGILIIAILLWMILPQLLDTIITLVNSLPKQADIYYKKLTNSIENNTYVAQRFQKVALSITKMMDEWVNNQLFPWLKSDLLPNVNSFAIQFANGVMNVLNVLYNLFIGCIVAIYLLASKETFCAQSKKIIYGIFHEKPAVIIIHYARVTNEMFGGFISGKLVDSTIIGIICFGVMSLFHLPYALLVSVIVGVTNIIPVFGPYIGAVPSALLILLVSPLQALYFIILLIILQQLDGNIIGPAILGESTGLSAFWVLFSILLFGGIWGIVGMLIGVPLFAVIYRIIKDYIELLLYKKKLSMNTIAYVNLKKIDMTENDHVKYKRFREEELLNSKKKKESEVKEQRESLVTILYPKKKEEVRKN